VKRRTVFAQLLIFTVISITVVAYALFDVIGVSVTNRPIHMTVELPTGGGIFEGSDVTLRGVHVGRVASVQLHRTRVTLQLSINKGAHIPANSIAHVYDLSVVGEQYVDFVPSADSGPYLRDGSVVPVTRTSTPIKTATVLYDLEQLVRSIDAHDVGTLSAELATAFGNSGPQLRQIITSGSQLVNELARAQPQTLDLLDNSATLLATTVAHAADFRAFATSLLALSATLKSSTPAASQLIHDSVPTTALIDGLVKQNAAAAGVLLSNLATFSSIQAENIPAFRALLVAVPQTGRLVPLVVRNGAIQAAALFNYTQPVCSYGTPLPSPLSPTRSDVARVGCSHVVPGELVRGAANAPQSGTLITQSGRVVQLGWDGGQSAALGANSWTSLILSGTGS
jgi:phospholipid/cholesterol/gamma-HCH transport system substrate-binding protein